MILPNTLGLISKARWTFPIGLLAGLLWLLSPLTPKTAETHAPSMPRELVVDGRMVCLAEDMHRLHGAELPSAHEHLFGFRSFTNGYFTVLRTRFSEALFADERVRARDLRLRARLFPDSRILEVMNLRALRDGKPLELVYFCAICNITMVSPEICECCRAETELIER